MQRLFHSLEESFKGATEEISDVRELIPEFYCLPDFLINKEKHNFGITQSGTRVHHVKPPRWCGENPYRFIAMMRAALESDIVSRNLHEWIDLIFGYKQSGKEAEKSLNVFYHLTYEDSIDLDNVTDKIMKTSYEAQIVHFGQTPIQLFTKPHPQRGPGLRFLSDSLMHLKVFKLQEKKNEKDADYPFPINHGNGIIKLKMTGETSIVGLRENGKVSYFKWQSSPPNVAVSSPTAFKLGVEKEKTVRFNRRKSKGMFYFRLIFVDDYFDSVDLSILYTSSPYVFLDSEKVSKQSFFFSTWPRLLQQEGIGTEDWRFIQ